MTGLRRIGLILLTVSLVMGTTAAGFICYNYDQDRKAAKQANGILNQWDKLPLISSDNDDFIRGTDMGPGYIGVLEIPVLGLILPINSEWTEAAAESSPCRYRGSISNKDLIIAGHNYSSHFGSLHTLQIGDDVYVTDAGQKKHTYKVENIEIIHGAAIDKMEAGEWDLTLFTCDYMGTRRITIRCQSVE